MKLSMLIVLSLAIKKLMSNDSKIPVTLFINCVRKLATNPVCESFEKDQIGDRLLPRRRATKEADDFVSVRRER